MNTLFTVIPKNKQCAMCCGSGFYTVSKGTESTEGRICPFCKGGSREYTNSGTEPCNICCNSGFYSIIQDNIRKGFICKHPHKEEWDKIYKWSHLDNAYIPIK